MHRPAAWGIIFFGLFTILSERVIPAPLGGRYKTNLGPKGPYHLSWMVMESPVVLLFLFYVLVGQNFGQTVPMVLTFIWMTHYVDRTFLYPFRTRHSTKGIYLMITVAAFFYNSVNAFVNGAWVGHFGTWDTSWLVDPRFIIGTMIFYAGWYINRKADQMLLNLRAPGETGYKIPRGWLYEQISCPNYFGEIVMWFGWAILTWSFAGLSFALFTLFNLGSHGLNHHKWYHEKFDDYPQDRKAVIPGVM